MWILVAVMLAFVGGVLALRHLASISLHAIIPACRSSTRHTTSAPSRELQPATRATFSARLELTKQDSAGNEEHVVSDGLQSMASLFAEVAYFCALECTSLQSPAISWERVHSL
jgi:hypothetical protein